ncbi:MAG: LuxR C-terminal-related transcriptional regulator [Bacteroidales bacterium]
MNRVLLKYSGNTIYVIEENGIDYNTLKDNLAKRGYKIIPVNGDKKSLEKFFPKKYKETKENYLIIIIENQPSRHIVEHLKHLNLTVEWLLSILNVCNIGFCIYNKEQYLAYNNIFQNITELSHESIKNARIGTFLSDKSRKSLKNHIKKCLDKEISKFSVDLEMKQKREGEKFYKFFGYTLNVKGNSLGVGYILNETHHDFDDPEKLRINKLIISELNQAFRMLNKIQSIDIHKMEKDSKEKIINKLAEDQPNYSRVNLSDREYEVLILIYKGYTNQQIANKLYISKRTVDFHRSNLLGKTNFRNTADLIRFAVQNHLIIE